MARWRWDLVLMAALLALALATHAVGARWAPAAPTRNGVVPTALDRWTGRICEWSPRGMRCPP